mmetsp:Transcript_134553/g.339863  ORF Transcript_134553/g.339863 Transcript_134553/m.339863 type:complete len:1124 (+) Transcript_134553:95-3466(+)
MLGVSGNVEETLLQRFLRAYGKLFGSRPELFAPFFVLACLGISIGGWWKPLVEQEKVIGGSKFASQWYVTGSRTQKHVDTWESEDGHHAWSPKAVTTIFTSRGDPETGDILTSAAFDEIFHLYRQWTSLSVSVGEKSYTTWDLCARGNLVDVPSMCTGLETTTTTLPTTTTTSVTRTTTSITTTKPPTKTTTAAPDANTYGWEYYTPTTTTRTTTESDENMTTTTAASRTTSTAARACVPSPYMPCLMVSPFQCFSEQHELNHISYQHLDSVISELDPLMLPYTARPSFRGTNDTWIKQHLSMPRNDARYDEEAPPGRSRGCHWFTSQGFFPVDLWAGRASWGEDGTSLAGARGLRLLFYLDGSRRAMERLGLTMPELADEDAIAVAMRELSRKWQALVAEHNSNFSHVEAANVEPWEYVEELVYSDPNAVTQYALFVSCGAGAAVLIYPCLFLSCRHPQASHGCLAAQGFLLIVLTLLTASGLFLLCGYQLSLVTAMTLPFLGWVSGIDYIVVLIRYLSQLGIDFIRIERRDEVLGEILATAGPGITFSCFCSILTFGFGMLTPIPAVRDLCVGAMLVTAVNYLVMMNVFAPLTLLEAWCIKTIKPDAHPLVCCCHRRAIRKARASFDAWDPDNDTMQKFKEDPQEGTWLREKYARFLRTRYAQFAAVVVAVALFVVADWNKGNRRIGFDPEEMLESSHEAYRGIQLLFDYFSVFPSNLCFYQVDVPGRQREVLDLYQAVTGSTYAVEGAFNNYLTTMYSVMTHSVLDLANVSEVPALMENDGELLAQQAGLNMSMASSGIAPYGMAPLDKDNFTEILLELLATPSDSAKAWSPATANGSRASLYLDLAGVNEFAWDPAFNESYQPRIRFTVMPFFTANLENDDHYHDAIDLAIAQLDASPLKDDAFIYGSTFTHWEVLGQLEPQLLAAIFRYTMVVLVGAFVIFEMDVIATLVVCLSCYMVVIEVYGFAVIWAKFNAYFFALMFASMGLAIEASSHLVASFAVARGSVETRFSSALANALPAVLASTCAVIGAILPLALFPVFYPALFYIRYPLGMLALHSVVVLINGLFIAPALLAMVAPPIEALRRKRAKLFRICSRCCRRQKAPQDAEALKREAKGDS